MSEEPPNGIQSDPILGVSWIIPVKTVPLVNIVEIREFAKSYGEPIEYRESRFKSVLFRVKIGRTFAEDATHWLNRTRIEGQQ